MTTREILEALPGLAVLVVGDICLDRWCTYDPAYAEASRETGIPRVAVVATETTPGAGGTVAGNAKALGVGRVAVLGAIGEDGFGLELARELDRRDISPDYLVRSPLISTFTYTKLINSVTRVEDRPRVDFINPQLLPEAVEAELIHALREVHLEFPVILVSDQAETNAGGAVTEGLRALFQELAVWRKDLVLWADSRLRMEHFRNVLMKVNTAEADAACERVFGRRDYGELRKHIAADLLMVTMGAQGVRVIGDEEEIVPARTRANPVDICGAGDSFSAGAACALAVGATPREAARFGNLVASITVMKPGTGTASPEEVLAADEAGLASSGE